MTQLSKNATKLAKQLRSLVGGRIFRVTFTKRTTGEERKLVCRLGVAKGVTGKGQSYDPASKGLITVYDIQKQGFRMIPIEGIKEFKINGTVYDMKEEE